MTDAVIFIILMVVIHVPVVGYAIYGAIKLAKLKKDPNYREEVKKKGPQPIKMVPPLIGFAAMTVIGALNLAGVMSFGTATLLYMGAPLFVLCLIGLIFVIIKRNKFKKEK
ncbi:MAG: hypothetical protein IJP60_00310 [Bacilli bacterium]|nr:hypothetical protein [Bacilli bacterium]